MKNEPSANVGTHSQRMVPDASGSQLAQSASASKKIRFDDDDDADADELNKYRSRLQQHMAGLEQAYFSRRLNNSGLLLHVNFTPCEKLEKCWLKHIELLIFFITFPDLSSSRYSKQGQCICIFP